MDAKQIHNSIEFCRNNIELEFDQMKMPYALRPMLLRSVHDHFNPRGNWGLERLDERIRKVELRPELWATWFEDSCKQLSELTVQRAISNVQLWHEALRELRVSRESVRPKTLQDRMHEILRQCSDDMTDAFYFSEGRKYSVSFTAAFGQEVKVEVAKRSKWNVDIYVTPAWLKKVGKDRAVMFKETKHRTFIYDSKPVFDREMSDRNVQCMILKGVGLMKEHYFKAELSRLCQRFDELNTNENLTYVDAYREYKIGNLNLSKLDSEIQAVLMDSRTLIDAFKRGEPCEYSLYYLEHRSLDLNSVGHTLHHAKNLLNRRLKKATLDALI